MSMRPFISRLSSAVDLIAKRIQQYRPRKVVQVSCGVGEDRNAALGRGSRARPAANALHEIRFRRVRRDVEPLVAGLAENVSAHTDARFEVETRRRNSGTARR